MRLEQRQSGFSLLGLIVTVLLVLAVFIPVLKTVPSLLEYQSVKRAAEHARMQGTSVTSAIAAFDKQAQVDGVTVVRGKDLDIQESAGGTIESVRFSYRSEILLYGPISLAIQYSGTQR